MTPARAQARSARKRRKPGALVELETSENGQTAPRRGRMLANMMTQAIVLIRDQMSTPLGELSVVTDSDGAVRALDWLDYDARMLRLLGQHYRAGFSLSAARAPAHVRGALEAYFQGDLCALDRLPVASGGSLFQREVWSALRSIPVGSTWSYSQLAEHIGKPRAVRAVGLANGANPISVIVPCHRVIGASGALTGYAGGIARKRWLLEHEGVKLTAAATRPAQLDLGAQP